MLEAQETEVTGSLNHEVSALTLIQVGCKEKAIRLLETRVGTAVTTLPQDREWDQLSESQRQSLVLAKKYFAIYPPQAQAEESLEHLHEVLQRIPDESLEPDSCSPAVRVLLLGLRGAPGLAVHGALPQGLKDRLAESRLLQLSFQRILLIHLDGGVGVAELLPIEHAVGAVAVGASE